MLVNLNLLCRSLVLFVLCRLASADHNYRLPRNTFSAHYPVRFEKPPLNVAASSSLEDSNEFGTNVYLQPDRSNERGLSELVSADDGLDENADRLEVVQDDTTDDDGAQGEQIGDLQPDHSNSELSHRLVRRKESKSEKPDAKEVIEFNSLDDQPTYSGLNDAKNEEDDNGLLKYKAKHDFEYSTNLLNDHSSFHTNAKMLGK